MRCPPPRCRSDRGDPGRQGWPGTLMTTLFAVAEISVAPAATSTDSRAVPVRPSPTWPTWLTPHAYTWPDAVTAYDVADPVARLW